MTFEEYRNQDAIGLAELVRTGETSPIELLNIAINRLEEVNPETNAVIHKLYDFAKDSIGNIDENTVFAGVPFLMKDIGTHLKGTPMNFGCSGYKNFISTEDSLVTTKIKNAGLITFAKTNTPEFGLTLYTEPKLHGPTRNPWNLSHSPGGSSGGSASAVASGITPIATANDGGGSIRNPAAYCGLFGLKPSRGRVSLGNIISESWQGAVAENCISRSVRDSAAYLDAIIGPGSGEPFIFQKPERSFLEETKIEPGRLKIAYSTEHTLGHEIDQECIDAVQNTVSILKNLGHEVTEVKNPWDKNDLKIGFTTIIFGEVASELRDLEKYLGRKVTSKDAEINTRSMALLGNTFNSGDFAHAKKQWGRLARNIGLFHDDYDLMLTPTNATIPPKIGEQLNTKTEDKLASVITSLGLGKLLKSQADKIAEKTFGYTPFTPIANMTGQPSMSVPMHWSKKNLPVGVMFTGRIGEDNILYRLAAQLEKTQPWFDKIPQL